MSVHISVLDASLSIRERSRRFYHYFPRSVAFMREGRILDTLLIEGVGTQRLLRALVSSLSSKRFRSEFDFDRLTTLARIYGLKPLVHDLLRYGVWIWTLAIGSGSASTGSNSDAS